MTHRATIGTKLSLCFSAMLAISLLLGATALYFIMNLGGMLEDTASILLKKTTLVGSIQAAASDLIATENQIILRNMVQDQGQVARLADEYRQVSQGMQRDLSEIEPLLETAEGRQIISDLKRAQAECARNHEEMAQALASQRGDVALKIFGERVTPMVQNMKARAEDLVRISRRIGEQRGKEAHSAKVTSTVAVVVLLVLAALVGGAAIYLVQRTTSSLRKLAQQLARSAEQVTAAGGQISSASQALAQGASEQAASLEETSASTEEMSSMTRRNAENSNAAANVVSESAAKTEAASTALKKLVVAMDEINASSEKISKIIKVIDEIAFQTNILALNAAVEAARAGEAGLGFAVVADEVRNLAQRCAQAAKDTAGLIEDSIQKASEGVGRVKEVEAAISGVIADATKIKTLVDEVNLGSQEQARGIEQVAKAIVEMEKVTQKTAASAEESASAGEELNAQATQLMNLVGSLRELVGGEHEELTVSRPQKRKPSTAPGAITTPKKAAAAAIPLEDDFREF